MIAIIDSGGANIASVMFALERLDARAVLTDDPAVISAAERVILPGVGAAKDAMVRLRQKELVNLIRELKQPVLGICLGMQLLFNHSEEGNAEMLGIISAPVSRFDGADMVIPHMGWNNVRFRGDHPLVRGLDDNSYFYFVHSYRAPVGAYTIGACDYGGEFSAIVTQDNFTGCQFHPERSGTAGQKILQNFLEVNA